MNDFARIFVALVAGFLGSRFAWLLLRNMFASPALQRENYRSHSVATAGGICVVVSVLVVEAVRGVLHGLGIGDEVTPIRMLTLLLVFGFGFLGLNDDLAAHGSERGFRGHLRALREGSLTTGGLKLMGGGMLAVLLIANANAFAPGRNTGLGYLLLDAFIVALGANTANLFDRAPGRTTKVGVFGFLLLVGGVVLLGTGKAGLRELVTVAVVVGGFLGLLHEEFRERVMLGDTGANVLGATLAFGVALSASLGARIVVVIALLALNVMSEFVSFSRIIESVAPLRWLDSLGRAQQSHENSRRGRRTDQP